MEIIVPGIVYLVGAGPGDPELLTLKALRLIKNCDALVHDALIPDEITKEAGINTEIFDVGKRAGHSAPMPHRQQRCEKTKNWRKNT